MDFGAGNRPEIFNKYIMITTSIPAELSKLRRIAINELIIAVDAHYGRYDYPKEPKVTLDSGETVKVVSVMMNAGKQISFSVRTSKNDLKEISLLRLNVSTINVLTNLIESTGIISDVRDNCLHGSLNIDPEVVFQLTSDTYSSFNDAGVSTSLRWHRIRDAAEFLTSKYEHTDWDEEDFWLLMEEEAQKLIDKVLGEPLHRLALGKYGFCRDEENDALNAKLLKVFYLVNNERKSTIEQLSLSINEDALPYIQRLEEDGFLQTDIQKLNVKVRYSLLQPHFENV